MVFGTFEPQCGQVSTPRSMLMSGSDSSMIGFLILVRDLSSSVSSVVSVGSGSGS